MIIDVCGGGAICTGMLTNWQRPVAGRGGGMTGWRGVGGKGMLRNWQRPGAGSGGG